MIDREKLYDLIYTKADKLLKEYNPCNIHKNNQGLLVCNNKQMCKDNEKLCCFQCKYQSINGCTIKCLGCKEALCNIPSTTFHQKFQFDGDCSSINADKTFKIKMWKLVRITMKYKLFFLHASKEELFEHYPIIEVSYATI